MDNNQIENDIIEFKENIAFLLEEYKKKHEQYCFFVGICNLVWNLQKDSIITFEKKEYLFIAIQLMFKLRDLYVLNKEYKSQFYNVECGEDSYLFVGDDRCYRARKRLIDIRINFMEFILNLSNEDIKKILS